MRMFQSLKLSSQVNVTVQILIAFEVEINIITVQNREFISLNLSHIDCVETCNDEGGPINREGLVKEKSMILQAS